MYVPKCYLDLPQLSFIIFVVDDQLTFGPGLVFTQSIGVATNSTGISGKLFPILYLPQTCQSHLHIDGMDGILGIGEVLTLI